MDWWNNYFKQAWPNIVTWAKTEEDTFIEADFVAEILLHYMAETTMKPLQILDIPCGSGRIALELAQRSEDYQFTGLDFSEKAIEEARKSAEEQGLSNVTFHIGDMRKLPFEQQFDAAICIFGSFGYFDDAGNEQFIAALSAVLKKGGLFILDTHVLETLLLHLTNKDYWEFGEDLVLLERRGFDYAESRLNSEWTSLQNGQKQISHSSVRIYAYRELIQLLNKYQLEVLDTFGTFTGEPFELGADNLLLICQKI